MKTVSIDCFTVYDKVHLRHC